MSFLNVIVLEFDPVLHMGDSGVKLETIALAVAIALSLVVAGLIARATPSGELSEASGELTEASDERREAEPAPAQDPGRRPTRRQHLRPDDLLFIAMGALPGAVLGGRIGYVLLHLDYYSSHVGQIADPAQGSLELTLGVVGGCLSAAYVLRLLDAPIERWAHVAAFPLLLVLGTGKLASALGGDGQGAPSDAAWATVYVGDGPWGSLAPEVPSHPAQLYEGILALVLLQAMTILVALGVFRRRDATPLIVGVAAWAIVRAAIATTWRDVPVLGPLLAEQLIALVVAGGCVGLLILRRARRRSRAPARDSAASAQASSEPASA